MRASGLNRWTIRRVATTGALYATAAAVLVVIVFPIYWMFSLSVKTEIEFFALPPTWFPAPTIENYVTAFGTRPLHRYIINSVVITTATTALSVAVGALAGYGFSRFRIAGSRYLLLAMLATRMIPPITLVFPLFIIMRDLGLLNTHAALILAYTTFNIPFATFLMHGFMAAVPRELDEAAMIDGCSRLRAFFTVILPTVKPGLIATAIMSALLAWKDFLWALRFTSTEAAQTIPIGIMTYVSDLGVEWGSLMAVSTLSVLPLLFFSLIVQKHMVRGLTSGAARG